MICKTLYNIIYKLKQHGSTRRDNHSAIKKETTMTKETNTNYSAEMTADVVARYVAGETVEAIATAVGKSTRSVVAKLSREGVYKSKAKAKTEVRVTKDELVSRIAEHIGVAEETIDSLEKSYCWHAKNRVRSFRS